MPRKPTESRSTGNAAESVAQRWLEQQGLTTLARNASFRVGEIDLVMRDHTHVVFVEVRYRKPSRFGDGLLSVSAEKRRRLVRAAQLWLTRNPALSNVPCRFDVVSVSGSTDAMTTDWVRNAFTLDDI